MLKRTSAHVYSLILIVIVEIIKIPEKRLNVVIGAITKAKIWINIESVKALRLAICICE